MLTIEKTNPVGEPKYPTINQAGKYIRDAEDDICNRAQTATMLHRFAKSPEVQINNSFADIAADSYYDKAVNWATKQGITSNTSSDTFSPNADCTRAQIVTSLQIHDKIEN